MAYIYLIYNDINNKVYIGKTNFSLEKRFKEHCRDCKKREEEKRPLYNAMNKYGTEHFFIKQLEEVDPNESDEREKYWINFYDSCRNGYNATLGGDGKNYLDYQKILHLYDNTSLTQQEIAEEVNCCPSSVYNIVKQYRESPNWAERYQNTEKHESKLINKKIRVRCVETGEEFESCTLAAKWLVSENKIKSPRYGRNKIPEVCRGIRKTVGGYHWEFA